jgi:hypothetical protein
MTCVLLPLLLPHLQECVLNALAHTEDLLDIGHLHSQLLELPLPMRIKKESADLLG